MRINQYVALATGLSRRKADEVITSGKVTVNGKSAETGLQVSAQDEVQLDGKIIIPAETQTILLNKPAGYVCSRQGQGSKTIYDLLPKELHNLKPIGRLDKDSSGLLLLTNDGELANQLTHPSFAKEKIYMVQLDKQLADTDLQQIEKGVQLEDGLSKLKLSGNGTSWTVTMSEGRNRQIRRTFSNLNYEVQKLHRIKFGDYKLGNLTEENYLPIG